MRQERMCLWAAWAGACLLIAFVVLVVAPGRGAGWMVDDGLFLANAWNVVHGFGLDGMLPQEPVYLVNALLMRLGATEILHQRYAYYALSGVGAWAFFSGLESGRTTWLRPIAIAGTLCISFSSILAMASFFLYAAGCYFHATKADGKRKAALLAASGMFFAVAAFMHAALAIAMFLIVVCIYLFDRSTRHSMLAPVFLAASLLLWGSYLQALGLDRFFAAPAGHEIHLMHLLGNVARIVWFFVSAILAFALVAFAFRRKGEQRFLWAQYSLSLLVTAAYCLKFLGMHLLSAFPEFFIDSGFGRYSVERLVNAPRLVIDAPGAIYYLLIFVLCRWLVESEYWKLESAIRRPLASWRTLANFLGSDATRMRFCVASLGLCLIAAGYAGGSASSFAICLSAFSGPVLGVVFIAWQFVEKESLKGVPVFLLSIWCCVFVVFAARMNLPTFEPIVYGPDRVTLTESPLRGLKETARYQEAVRQLKAAYAQNGCEDKRLVLMDYVPTVHLILQHEVPNRYGVVRPGVYFPEDKVMQELESPVGWCVLDVTTDETRTMMRERDIRVAVRGRVKEEQRNSIELLSPSRDIEPMVLYVK